MKNKIQLSLNSLRKTVGKVSPILVTVTSHSDSNFERSNISLKENKRDGVDQNHNGLIHATAAFERKKKKFYGFQQTVNIFNQRTDYLLIF